jgi:hypothetical protein
VVRGWPGSRAPDVRFSSGATADVLLWPPTRDARRACSPSAPGAGTPAPVEEIAGIRVTGFVSPTHVLRSGPPTCVCVNGGRSATACYSSVRAPTATRFARHFPVVVLYLQVEPGG